MIQKNPGYMKENFVICIETLHAGDVGDQQNVSVVNASRDRSSLVAVHFSHSLFHWL